MKICDICGPLCERWTSMWHWSKNSWKLKSATHFSKHYLSHRLCKRFGQCRILIPLGSLSISQILIAHSSLVNERGNPRNPLSPSRIEGQRTLSLPKKIGWGVKIYYICAIRETHSTETIGVALRLVFLLICQLGLWISYTWKILERAIIIDEVHFVGRAWNR